jgi:hypothetical protein
MDSEFLNAIKQAYYDPKNPASFGGIKRLLKSLKQEHPNIKREDVVKWLHSQGPYTMYRFSRKQNYHRKPNRTSGIDDSWAADLADFSSDPAMVRANAGHKYALIACDIFSKYGFVQPLKDKSGSTVTAAMKEIFTTSGRQPSNLVTDAGTEFLNAQMQNLLKLYGTKHITAYGPHKAAVAERLIRTIKTRLWKYFELNKTNVWVDVIGEFMKSYNRTVHSTTGLEPARTGIDQSAQVMQMLKKREDKLFKKRAAAKKPRFKIGDVIRLAQFRSDKTNANMFRKGYLRRFSREYYKVVKRNTTYPYSYKLAKYSEPDKVINGIYYEPEMQSITFSESQPKIQNIPVQKVLARRIVGGLAQSLVKFKDLPNSENRWIPDTDLSVRHKNV